MGYYENLYETTGQGVSKRDNKWWGMMGRDGVGRCGEAHCNNQCCRLVTYVTGWDGKIF